MKQMHTANCLIIYNKNNLRLIHFGVQRYYINAKGCFYIYFRQREQMYKAERKFEQQGVKYTRRPSILPSPQQYENIVDHCLYNRQKAAKNNPQKKHSQPFINKYYPSKIENSHYSRDQQMRINSQKPQQRNKNRAIDNQQSRRYKSDSIEQQYSRKHRNDPFVSQDNRHDQLEIQNSFSRNKRQIVNKFQQIEKTDKIVQEQQSKCNQQIAIPVSIKHILTNKVLMNKIFCSFQ